MPKAVRAADFLDTMGVNTHFHQAGQYDDIARSVAALDYLGIDHVREADIPDPEWDALAAAGAKVDLFVYPGRSPADNVADIKALVQKHPGLVRSIEGPNEVDLWQVNYAGKTGLAGAQAYQAELFRLVNAEPLLKDIPVFNFSWGVGPADKPGEADWANVHAYRPHGHQPINGMKWHLDYQQNVMPGKPMALTETGYYTLPNDDNWGGVDDRSQAALTLNTFFRADAFGVERTFLYQMFDQYNDGRGREANFGLFNYDFSPKPVAHAIHNLTTILGDEGANAATFAPGALDYVVRGSAPNLGTKLLQESDGTFDLVVWAEPDIWDEGANRPITAPVSPLTVELGKSFASVKVYDPLRGADPIQTFSNTSSVRLDVTDHPLVVEVSGSVGATPAPTPPTTPEPTPTPTPAPGAINGTANADTLNGTAGNNTANGLAGNDTINGNDGNDTLNGEAGWDRLVGGNGDDRLDGGVGEDTYSGGPGRDVFVVRENEGRDWITDFVRGEDTLLLQDMTASDATIQVTTYEGFAGTLVKFNAGGQVFLQGASGLAPAPDYALI
jgi:RTX calcium-binding nonapeptide repeat (4 copies)